MYAKLSFVTVKWCRSINASAKKHANVFLFGTQTTDRSRYTHVGRERTPKPKAPNGAAIR